MLSRKAPEREDGEDGQQAAAVEACEPRALVAEQIDDHRDVGAEQQVGRVEDVVGEAVVTLEQIRGQAAPHRH